MKPLFRTLVIFVALQPAAAQGRGVAAAAVKDSFAALPTTRQSWTSDRAHFGIGDIVTILIDERTLASANLADNNAERKKKGLGLDVEPPSTPGKAASGTKVTMDFNNDGDSRKSGEAVRKNNFRSEMSARVIGVSPTGMLQIQGHKLVDVDKNQQDVTVTGWVRPQDVAVGSNTIESSRIADATINYVQKGALGRPRGGILGRVIGWIWP